MSRLILVGMPLPIPAQLASPSDMAGNLPREDWNRKKRLRKAQKRTVPRKAGGRTRVHA